MGDVLFLAPGNLDEVFEFWDPDTVLLGGGTALAQLVKEHMLSPRAFAWLGRVSELQRGIEVGSDGTVHLSAFTSIEEVARSDDVRRLHPMVAEAAGKVANPRIRSVATVGGAIAHADARQDLLPPLVAANATVTLASAEGTRTLSLREGFFLGFMETAIRDGEVITRVTLAPAPGSRSRYIRFTPQSADDYPTVSVACRVRRNSAGALEGVDLAVGGVGSTVVALDDPGPLEADREAIRVFAEAAPETLSPLSDRRGSAEYKRAMAGVWIARVLEDLLLS